jgi:hypothetical protein
MKLQRVEDKVPLKGAEISETGDDLRQLVDRELEEILRGPSFCNSRQSERLLRYLVGQSLGGREDLLHEKQVGAAVFGRQPGYDTTVDPIVRVRVNEIRKRLAKHYQTVADARPVRFEILAGNYRVRFVTPKPEPSVTEPQPVHRAPGRWWNAAPWYAYLGLVLAIVVLIAGLIAGSVWLRSPAKGAAEEFWGPAMRSPQPVILCVGHPVVYRLSRKYWLRGNATPPDHFQYQTVAPQLPPHQHLNTEDIVVIPDQYIGLGSAYAMARISALLARNHKESEIRFGNDVSFTDLKRAPSVLIGAFSNRWTLEITKDHRFVFETVGEVPVVRDRQSGKVWALSGLQENGRTPEDYVIVTRMLESKTGQFTVIAAGITQYGCQAAGDVLTNPGRLELIARALPRGWQAKSLQLLLHVPMVGQSPGTPSLIAFQLW